MAAYASRSARAATGQSPGDGEAGARPSGRGEYDFRLDEKFPPLTRFDVAAEAAAHQPWFNQTLARIDDSVLRLGVLEGDFHWHKHDGEDELFLVLEGKLTIEVEGAAPITLEPHQAVTIPKGTMHCPHAHGRTVVLMIERATVKPAGD